MRSERESLGAEPEHVCLGLCIVVESTRSRPVHEYRYLAAREIRNDSARRVQSELDFYYVERKDSIP